MKKISQRTLRTLASALYFASAYEYSLADAYGQKGREAKSARRRAKEFLQLREKVVAAYQEIEQKVLASRRPKP